MLVAEELEAPKDVVEKLEQEVWKNCHRKVAVHDGAVVVEENQHALVKTPPTPKLEALSGWNWFEKLLWCPPPHCEPRLVHLHTVQLVAPQLDLNSHELWGGPVVIMLACTWLARASSDQGPRDCFLTKAGTWDENLKRTPRDPSQASPQGRVDLVF